MHIKLLPFLPLFVGLDHDREDVSAVVAELPSLVIYPLVDEERDPSRAFISLLLGSIDRRRLSLGDGWWLRTDLENTFHTGLLQKYTVVRVQR